jgi:two-component system, NarL family, sensor kinase
MSRHLEHSLESQMHLGAPPPQRHLYLGTLLQFALRIVIVIFITVTLLWEPPSKHAWLCFTLLAAYAVIVGCWSLWALRRGSRVAVAGRTGVTLLVLSADVAVLCVISLLTGITSPEVWTSDVISSGLFLIPLIAAAQLDTTISAAMAVPTISAFFVTCAATRMANEEPWPSILLNTAVLAALAGGSVAVSLIQRARVEMIEELAEQRTQLLQDLLGLEKRERQAISERLHDGALQYVLVARQDMEDVREGSGEAVNRVDAALVECSGLLRDVVRELHPEVLTRSGLKAAIETLAGSISTRGDLVIEVDARTWPDDLRTDADHVLYGAAREALTNVIKHARAQTVWVELEHNGGRATLRIADDGVGIAEDKFVKSLEDGHIGMASTRTKVLAAEGLFDVRATSPGTEVTVCIPLHSAESRSAADELAPL